MSRISILIACGLGLAGLVAFLAWRFPEALIHQDGQVQLTHALLFVAVIGGAAILHGRLRVRQALRDAAVWIIIGTVVLAGYSYRHEFSDLGNRMLGELLPHHGQTGEGGSVTLRLGNRGHFIAESQVNGVDIRFLVDTGASDVTLSPADAQRLGFDLDNLNFNRVYQTANGTVMGAPIRLDEVRLGSIIVRDVRASVNGADMRNSLLGMSFLNRLSRYEVSRDQLTLYP